MTAKMRMCSWFKANFLTPSRDLRSLDFVAKEATLGSLGFGKEFYTTVLASRTSQTFWGQLLTFIICRFSISVSMPWPFSSSDLYRFVSRMDMGMAIVRSSGELSHRIRGKREERLAVSRIVASLCDVESGEVSEVS